MAPQPPVGFEWIQYPSQDVTSNKEKEIEVFHQSGVGIYEGKTRCIHFDKGKVILTSFRIVWIDTDTIKNTIALPLDKIITFDEESGFLSSSPKITLTINNYQSGSLSSTENAPSLSPSQAIAYIPQLTEWTCPICSYLYSFASVIDGKIKCPECGVSSAASAKQVSHASPRSSWICTICDATNNDPAITKCHVCGVAIAALAPRATTPSPSGPSSSRGPLEPILTADDFSPIPTSMIKLSFRSGGAAKFAAHLKTVLERRAWTLRDSYRPQSAGPSSSNHGLGLTSIMKKMDLHQQQTQSNMTVAFEDLNSLILKAAEMTQLAERISKQITNSPTLLGTQEASFIQDFFSSLGIASPITKELVGSGYHFELAKELARLLPNLISNPAQDTLPTKPSFISLLDLYCVWNRARGAALISPQDLTKAISILPSIQSPFVTKTYGHGLVTITYASNDDAFILKKLEEIFLVKQPDRANPTVSLSAFDYSVMEKMSVTIAKEQLLMAEMKGLLCRDETLEGVLFYPNRILFK